MTGQPTASTGLKRGRPFPLRGKRVRILDRHPRGGQEAVLRTRYSEFAEAYWAKLGSGLETVVRPADIEMLP